MFKSILRRFGVGGASVETVLHDEAVEVGGTLRGEVRITGGDHDQDIRAVVLELATRCIAERGDNKHHMDFVLGTARLDPGRVRAGEARTLPFEIRLPPATPISVGSTHTMLRTRLDVEGAVDPRDSDPVTVLPSRTIRAVIEGVERAGFRLAEAEVEYNPRRAEPLVQEFDFKPRSRGDWGIEEVELAFRPVPGGTEVTLTVDNRGGLFLAGRERRARFTLGDAEAGRLDMAAELRRAIDGLRR